MLKESGARGKLVIPVRWGSYASWRLYPQIKISVDGRYETAFPESTFQMNRNFFFKLGKDWDKLLREYDVDYIIIEMVRTGLQPDDLHRKGFDHVYYSKRFALFSRKKLTPKVKKRAKQKSTSKIAALDAHIPDIWWK